MDNGIEFRKIPHRKKPVQCLSEKSTSFLFWYDNIQPIKGYDSSLKGNNKVGTHKTKWIQYNYVHEIKINF